MHAKKRGQKENKTKARKQQRTKQGNAKGPIAKAKQKEQKKPPKTPIMSSHFQPIFIPNVYLNLKFKSSLS